MMWIFARRLDAGVWRPRAEHYCELLRGREFDREIHDPGFTFPHSWRPWSAAAGDRALDDVVVQAGKTMGPRFQEKSGVLSSFRARDSTVINSPRARALGRVISGATWTR